MRYSIVGLSSQTTTLHLRFLFYYQGIQLQFKGKEIKTRTKVWKIK